MSLVSVGSFSLAMVMAGWIEHTPTLHKGGVEGGRGDVGCAPVDAYSGYISKHKVTRLPCAKLIKVRLRFSKTLFVDISLLRVLGGASIAELAEEAAGRLSPSAIPLVPSGERSTVPSSSEGDNSSESESSPRRRDSSVDTPLTTAIDREYDDKVIGSSMQRRVPLSLIQEYSWKLQQQLSDDPTIFHNTIGVFMEGPVDHERLTKALTSALSRHEIFRTAVVCEDGAGSLPLQVIQPTAATRIRYVSVADRAAAEESYNQLEKEPYDLASGERDLEGYRPVLGTRPTSFHHWLPSLGR